jgi:SHS2 domain-containing protein
MRPTDDFEIVGTTADIGLRVYGEDLAAVYKNTAAGMFSLITDLDTIREKTHRKVIATASDREALLVEWLNELIFLFDTERMLFKRYKITDLSDTRIEADCYGEKADRSRHVLKRGIKSATYHRLKIEAPSGGKWQAEIIFDI